MHRSPWRGAKHHATPDYEPRHAVRRQRLFARAFLAVAVTFFLLTS